MGGMGVRVSRVDDKTYNHFDLEHLIRGVLPLASGGRRNLFVMDYWVGDRHCEAFVKG